MKTLPTKIQAYLLMLGQGKNSYEARRALDISDQVYAYWQKKLGWPRVNRGPKRVTYRSEAVYQMEGLIPQREIARLRGISEKRVSFMLCRAKHRLKRPLNQILVGNRN